MEQATNQFNKGLLMDTHPMVQGNDTLTDCLNGTLITMNGNEVILLNDMGNRRVDNAFLPPGYLPVGMKEYGGIIYIAAYNPITNKSQIGSFPSPERKIDSIEYDNTPTALFDFDSFFDSNNVEKDEELGINVLKSDSFLIPVSNNVNIHSGDKFVVYSSRMSSLWNKLTNYNNIVKIKLPGSTDLGNVLYNFREMVYSPKNKKYTLLLGILNSQNEFVDITKTLCRWTKDGEKWVPKEYNSEKSDLYIFNDGYFIPDNFEDPLSGGTIDDKTLIKERLKIPANTYSYKLVGPIYLKVHLNHISLFNYNLYGSINKEKHTLITVEGTIVYNCEDGISSLNKTAPDSVNYFDFLEGTPKDGFGFDFIGKDADLISDATKIGESVYDETTNTYKVKITKVYDIGENKTNGLYSYVIGVKALYNTESIYLRGCSVKGLLDLSLLGTGTLQLKKWKFSNGENSSTISYRFNYYKKVNENISNLRIKFTNIKDESNVITYNLSLLSGTEIISWGESYPFRERSVYKVLFIYDSINEETKTIIEKDIIYKEIKGLDFERWFLTTSLFDEFFNNGNISDFCNLDGVPTNTVEAFNEKMEIPFNFKFDYSWAGNTEFDYSSNIKGELISLEKDIAYEGTNSSHRELYINNIENTPNLINYPNFITLGSLDYTISYPKIKLNELEYGGTNKVVYELKDFVEIKRGSECNLYLKLKFKIPILTMQSSISTGINSKRIVLDISNTYGYYGYNNDPVPSITNGFTLYDETLSDMIPTSGHYGKVFPESEYIGGVGGKNKHWFWIINKADSATSVGTKNSIDDGETNSAMTFNLEDSFGKLIDNFNNGSTSNLMFMYSFYTYPNLSFELHDYDGTIRNLKDYARVWWKTNNNEWALIPKLFKKDWTTREEEKTSFKELFGHKGYVYCVYDSYNYANDNEHKYPIYAAENNYIYTTYSIPLNIVIYFNLKNSNNILDTTDCGNLKFSIKNLSKVRREFKNVSILKTPKEEFIDRINTFDYNHVSNVYLPKALLLDTNKDALVKNKIYKYNPGPSLSPTLTNIFKIDDKNKVNGKNTLKVHLDNIWLNNDIKDWEYDPKTYVNYENTSIMEYF